MCLPSSWMCEMVGLTRWRSEAVPRSPSPACLTLYSMLLLEPQSSRMAGGEGNRHYFFAREDLVGGRRYSIPLLVAKAAA